MPLTYIIESTDSTLSFRLNPGEKDGYSGTQRNSDLTLQGYGVLSWGEDVNENLLRTLENHACPPKEINDYNPSSGLYDYDPLTDPLLPKQEGDQQTGTQNFGPGKGINTPIYGQLWFNKNDNRMYQYTQNDEWTTVSGVPTVQPTNPIDGDLWYDEAIPQLKIWNGLAWESVAERYVLKAGDIMTGQLSLTAGNPLDPEHATNKAYVDFEIDDKAVQRLGDTMTGILTLFADPSNPLDAATKNYVDTEIVAAGHVERTGDTMTGDLVMDNANIIINPDGNTGGIAILPTDLNTSGAVIQLYTAFVGDGSQSTKPPAIEFWNNQNSAVTGGTHGTWGWTRWIPRDGTVMRLEADPDPVSFVGPNTKNIMDIGQDGLMQYFGIGTGTLNVIRTPNASVSDIDANSKNLTTKEYVEAVGVNIVNSISSGPVFISPRTITTGNTGGNWVTINAKSYGVPDGANTVIVDYLVEKGEGGKPKLELRDHANHSHSTVIGVFQIYVGGGHSGSVGQAGIGMMNISSAERFDYRIESQVNCRLRITGYFT